MKSNGTSKKLPVRPAQWPAIIVAAPGKSRATAQETAQWDNAVAVNGGGYKAVREAVAAKRKQVNMHGRRTEAMGVCADACYPVIRRISE